MNDLHNHRPTIVAGLASGACVAVVVIAVATLLRSPEDAAPRETSAPNTRPAAIQRPAPAERTTAVPAAPTVVSPPSTVRITKSDRLIVPSSSAGASTGPRLAAVPSPEAQSTPRVAAPVAAAPVVAAPVVPPPRDAGAEAVARLDQANTPEAQPAAPAETAGVFVTASATNPTTSRRAVGAPQPGPQGLVILQIGDSHTSADFLSGEMRRRLQQRYGNGGPGYITAGRPHIGVRSASVKLGMSSGWTYHAIQKSSNIQEFWLSGFNTVTSLPGETLSFTSDTPMVFNSVEIEALRQPGGGSFDISFDGTVKASYDLSAQKAEPLVLRLSPDGVPTDRVRQIEIRTQGEGTVSIASIAIYNRQSGITYNSIGYPGATVDLLNKFDQALMADDLRRLNPQIVIVSFGTNEASKPNLDAGRYEQNYEKALGKIKAALPDAQIVLIGPPDGAERGPHCSGKASPETACHPAPPMDATPVETQGASSKGRECDWHVLPKLEMIRTVERKIAERHGYVYWNWASIMPKECGSHTWATASPPLMAPDHVHFTISGYNRSAEQFMDVLVPMIDKLSAKSAIVSNN